MSSVESSFLIAGATKFVKEYMSNLDASHNYEHIQRVLALAKKILAAEQASNSKVTYDPTTVALGALMHDIGDHKYADLSVNRNLAVNNSTTSPDYNPDPTAIIYTTLLSLGASPALASCIQTIAKNVSYSKETQNPANLQAILKKHPELGIVQDADRLDALGAIGIGRTFTFGGVRGRKGGLQYNVDHFEEKLYKVQSKMKTEEGRRLAGVRTETCRQFEKWWNEEMREGCEAEG